MTENRSIFEVFEESQKMSWSVKDWHRQYETIMANFSGIMPSYLLVSRNSRSILYYITIYSVSKIKLNIYKILVECKFGIIVINHQQPVDLLKVVKIC